jgi:predicted signal transduction protein with EAL and GGDEF domain
LHDYGIRVSIDDFGTGYTSLAAIPHLPLDEIKVDMSFVKAALTSRADEAIVRSVRELTHRLGLVSVAEGVEDAAIGAPHDRHRIRSPAGLSLRQTPGRRPIVEFVRSLASARSAPVSLPVPT